MSTQFQSATVLSFNILARPFTTYNTSFHRNYDGEMRRRGGRGGPLESLEQTQARYSLVTVEIMNQLPDAVLLQEIETAFLSDVSVNPKVHALLNEYTVASLCVTREGSAGTAVLVRNNGSLSVPRNENGEPFSFRVFGSKQLTGSDSKCAAGVRVLLDEQPLVLVSLHSQRNQTPCHKLCELIRSALATMQPHVPDEHVANERILIGGDFNREGDFLRERIDWLRTLTHVDFRVPTACGANFDRPMFIDHMFISPVGISISKLLCERPSSSPYGVGAPAAVVGPSDHSWVSCELRCVSTDVSSSTPSTPAKFVFPNPASDSITAGGNRRSGRGRGRGRGRDRGRR